MNSSVEEIKSKVNIVDLVGDYVQLQRAGANWKARCPFHNEKSPSFMVHEEKQIWHCFGCGKGGDVFGFLMEIEGLEFKEALKLLAEKAGVKLPEYKRGSESSEGTDKNTLLEILNLSSKFFEKQLWDGAGKNKILEYLRGRGLADKTIKEFQLGYAPAGWRNLLTFLAGRGYKIEDIAKTGLLVEKITNNSQSTTNKAVSSKPLAINQKYYDRFRDRIIFPISDPFGRVIGFSARVSPGQDESQAKYVNTPETAVYHKSYVLYGIDKAKKNIKEKKYTLLVEGNTDVIACHQAGLKNAVAVSGTALTVEQLNILKRYSENIKMFFDMDSAGLAAAERSATLGFEKDLNVFIVESDKGKDAAEIAAAGAQYLLEAVEKAVPAMELFLAKIFSRYDKSRIADKKNIAKDALNLIRHCGSDIEKSFWLKKLAVELEVEEKTLADILKKVSGKGAPRRFSKDQKENPPAAGNRLEKIKEKIAGLMLSEANIWKKIESWKNEDYFPMLLEDDLLKEAVEKGREAGYFYENLLTRLSSDEERKKAIRLYSEASFQFEEAELAKENPPKEKEEQIKEYIGEIKNEYLRRKLKNIAGDLKKAEKSKDLQAVKFLSGEFSKISRTLNQSN